MNLPEGLGSLKAILARLKTLKENPQSVHCRRSPMFWRWTFFSSLSGEIQNSDAQNLTIVKKVERKTVTRPIGSLAYTYDAITYKKLNRLMEGYIVTIGFEFPPEPFVHEGQELTYVLEGTHEFVYDGKSYLFEEGDCYYFDSNRPHYARAVGEKLGKLLVVFAVKRD